MKSIKLIFIAMETAMLFTVIMLTFFTDWNKAIETESAWMFQLLIVLCSILAVTFQREQQSIEWDDED